MGLNFSKQAVIVGFNFDFTFANIVNYASLITTFTKVKKKNYC